MKTRASSIVHGLCWVAVRRYSGLVTVDRSMEEALREVLGSVRLETSVMSRAHLRSPWAVASGGLPRAIFHAMVEGECHVQPEGHEVALHMRPGDVALLTQGPAHVLSDGWWQPPRTHGAAPHARRRHLCEDPRVRRQRRYHPDHLRQLRAAPRCGGPAGGCGWPPSCYAARA